MCYYTDREGKGNDMETVSKTMRMPVWLVEKIEAMAEEEERTFTQQVIMLLKKGIKLHSLAQDTEEKVFNELLNGTEKERHAQ